MMQELDATRRQLDAAQQQIEQLKAEVDSLKQLKTEVAGLKQRQQHTHSTALKAVQDAGELRRAVESLQGEASRTQKLEEQLGHVHSRTMQLTEQQHREECQRAVVFKTPTPLPAQRSQQAKTAGEFLTQLIGQQVTVLRVQELGGKSRKDGSSPRGGQQRHVYKLLLPSSEARDALLRAKASKLRNTPYTIDVCLTPQQAANKAVRLPAAKAAREAGQRVQWRYDSLYIDGQPHGKEGPPLSPAGQQQQPQQQQQGPSAASSSPQSPAHTPVSSSPAEAAASPEREEPEEGEFQEVRSKLKRRRQPSTSATASGNKPAARPTKEGSRAAATKASGAKTAPPRASPPLAGKTKSRAGDGGSSSSGNSRGSGSPRGDGSSNNNGSRKATNNSELPSMRGARSHGGQRGDGRQQQRRQQQQQQRRASPPTTPTRA